jgi:hypothetical protein
MKKLILLNLAIVVVLGLSSCSRNNFQTRKNYHSRIKVEASNISPTQEIVINQLVIREVPSQKISPVHQSVPQVKIIKPKETLMEKMATVFIPNKKELLRPVFHPAKKAALPPDEGGDRTTGLVINLLALAFGIAAVLMVIGMVHGNVWVYFVVGLVLAIATIIMGFIGKMMAWKAFGWLAGVIGILAVVLLLIFLLLVTVVHVAF